MTLVAGNRVRIALTPGDPRGIGPEITLKLLQKRGRDFKTRGIELLLVGAKSPFVGVVEDSMLLAAPETAPEGVLLEGWQTGWAIQTAAGLVGSGQCDALVTGPIHKERLQQGGWRYSGHTDFLADHFKVPDVTMMLANDRLRVSLVTVHTALENVPRLLNEEGIVRAIRQTIAGLSRYWGVREPRIAVTSLNPHAGEGGLFGNQEKNVILPAIARARGLEPSAKITGPLPADTLFARIPGMPESERPDAVIAMYHDQGLIPVKMIDFARTVNLTLGLPILRTSVDHGTAFDIAGQGIADPSSLEAAVELAVTAARNPRPS